jgi:hypothetical protein
MHVTADFERRDFVPHSELSMWLIQLCTRLPIELDRLVR